MIRTTIILIILVILITALNPLTVNAAGNIVKSISVSIYYDPASGIAAVVQELTLNQQGRTEGVIITLPLINASGIEILNVTDSSNSAILYDYNPSSNTITIYANNTGTVKIYYTLSGLMDEIAPETYSGILDLSGYAGIDVSAMIQVEGAYEALVEPSGNYKIVGNTTIITLQGADTYTISLVGQITTPKPTTPAFPGGTGGTTTSPGGASGGQSTTATRTSATASATTGVPGGISTTMVILIITAIIIVAIVAVALARR